MKLLSYTLIGLFSLALTAKLKSQEESGPNWDLIHYSYLQEAIIIPPSPQAASFTRYDKFDSPNYTGTANINIDLCSIGDDALQFPVSLYYNTGGIKVNDLPGWAGLGWSLSAGGVVTRTIIGHPDIAVNYYNSPSNWPQQSSTNPDKIAERKFLDSLAYGHIEAQPDVYSFNFGSYNGNFIIKKDYSILIDKEEFLTIGSVGPSSVVIWDAAGFKYTFSATEKTTYHVEAAGGMGVNMIFDFTSTWYLTEIQHPNEAEGKIVFEYSSIPGYQDRLIGLGDLTSWVYNMGGDVCCPSSGLGGPYSADFNEQKIYDRKIISKISFYKNSIKRQELVFTRGAIQNVAKVIKCVP